MIGATTTINNLLIHETNHHLQSIDHNDTTEHTHAHNAVDHSHEKATQPRTLILRSAYNVSSPNVQFQNRLISDLVYGLDRPPKA